MARAETQLQPERDGGDERHACEEVGGKFVIAGCNAAEVLDLAECVLDEVATSVALLIVADGTLAVAPARDNGAGSVLAQCLAQTVAS